jgi:phosphatidylethanolamine/phosphatidyl-N-methylethanolamine N-methyltransferase
MAAADILPFFRAWVRNPWQVAAVAPCRGPRCRP